MITQNIDKHDYKYIFYLPSYQSNSNGIICMWDAAYHFSKNRDVSIIITDSQNVDLSLISSKLPKRYNQITVYYNNKEQAGKVGRDNWYYFDKPVYAKKVIHVVPDDPHNYLNNFSFDQKRVVNYLMCRSLLLSEKLLPMSDDNYGLSYSNAVSTVFPSYCILNDKIINIKNSYEDKAKKNKVLIYYGKTRYGLSFKNLKNIIAQFDEVEIVHRCYPTSKRVLYEKISESSLFISIDPLTSLMHESTLIGTPVYVYDSVFKDFYDKFDFKLHGFYYNLKPSDLENIFKVSENLSEKASDTAKKFMVNINERTINTINNIENHFNKRLCSTTLYKYAINEDIKFLNDKWKLTTIFNCTSYKTIHRYHLINKYKALALVALYFYRIFLRISNSLKKLFFKNYLATEEKVIIKKYLRKKPMNVIYDHKEIKKIKKFLT